MEVVNTAITVTIACIVLLAGISILVSSSSSYTGQYSEVWSGTSGVAKTLTYYVGSISYMANASPQTIRNTTAITYTGTEYLSLTDPYSGVNANLTVVHTNETGVSTAVSFNGHNLGNLSNTSLSDTFTVSGAYLINGSNAILFTNQTSIDNATIYNSSLTSYSFSSYAGYTLSNGAITPTTNGTFYTEYYTLGSTQLSLANVMLGAIIVIFAIAGIYFLFFKEWGLFS